MNVEVIGVYYPTHYSVARTIIDLRCALEHMEIAECYNGYAIPTNNGAMIPC